MFAPSIREILAIGIPLIMFAGFASGQPKDVQFIVALWGGWLGALTYFVILKLEFLNPFKFIMLFIILPGFLLGMSYFTYRKPSELKKVAPPIEVYVQTELKHEDVDTAAYTEKERELLIGLAKDCAWIWLVGSALAAFILGPLYRRCIQRFDYAYRDSKRSRGLLGKKPTEVRARDLPPKLEDANTGRVSIPSNLPPKPRVTETAFEKEGLLVGPDSEGDEENYWVDQTK